jgi:tRNA/rRNA methyltransferase
MLKGLSVALMEPSYEVNVGHVARLVKNFGAERLILVNPIVQLDPCRKFASHAVDILEKALVYNNFNEILENFDAVIGSTAIRAQKLSNVLRQTLTPEDAAKVLESMQRESKSVCLLLGRDTTGLTNEELGECDFAISIPIRSNYKTLNISHALAIMLYQLSKVKVGGSLVQHIPSRDDKKRLVVEAVRLASASGLPKYRITTLRKALWTIIGRSQPRKKEVFLLTGFFRKATIAIEKARLGHKDLSKT